MRVLPLLLLSLFLVLSPCHSLISPLYRAYRHALPQFLFDGLLEDAKRLADYESEMPTLQDYKRATHWFPLDGSVVPRTFHELAIERLLGFIKRDAKYKQIVGCEYWVQRVNPNGKTSIGFHVDKDESVASLKHYLLHPLWSSVFYLTEQGGGTLITNQYSPRGSGYEPEQAQEGVWSFPEANKFTLFNGTLLHGVVSDQAAPNTREPRITFLVNFWLSVPEPPNCAKLDHSSVRGLKLYSKKQMKAYRDRMNEEIKTSEEKQRNIPLDLVDLTKTRADPQKAVNEEGRIHVVRSPSSVPYYSFRMELPGKQEQFVTLPVLNHRDTEGTEREVRGRLFYLVWRNVRRIDIEKEMAIQRDRDNGVAPAAASAAGSASGEAAHEEKVKDEDEEDSDSDKPARRAKSPKSSPSSSSSASLAAARAAKEALKAKLQEKLENGMKSEL